MELRCPGDISIVGYDNAEMSQYMSPPLTTIQVRVEKIAHMTIDGLLRIIEKKEKLPVCSKLEEFQLIKRGKCSRGKMKEIK